MNSSITTDGPTIITFKRGLPATAATHDEVKQDRMKATASPPAPPLGNSTAQYQEFFTTLHDQHHLSQHNWTPNLEPKSCSSNLSQTLLDRRVLLQMAAESLVLTSGSCNDVEDIQDDDFEYLNEIEDTTSYFGSISSLPQSHDKVDSLQLDLYLLSSLNQRIAEIEAGDYNDEDDGDSFNSDMTEDSIDITKRRLLRCKTGRTG